jgi:SNF2 family DNA or RNA helicase
MSALHERECSCGLLPCICVDDDAADALELQMQPTAEHAPSGGGGGGGGDARATLRQLFAANASVECASCMMLPCICPAEDDLLVEDETTSVEAASPPADHQMGDGAQDGEPEETDVYGRVRLGSILPASAVATDEAEKTSCRDVWIAREIKRFLKPHQVDGVRFLADNVRAERGCILADYMGLGKTLQVITAIHSFMVDQIEARESASTTGDEQMSTEAVYDPITTIVLCPAICIPNWESEFKKWLSTESLELCPVLSLDSTTGKGTTAGRIRVLQKWKRQGGVLLIGYEMFRSLLNPTLAVSVDREPVIQVCTRVSSSTMEVTESLSAKTQKFAQEFCKLLCNPGADLVVLDEGHRMKDPSSLLCQSVAKIHSHRRLVLTGYPVQVCLGLLSPPS